MTDNEMRRLLDDAVPDLPAPADRLTAVAARVRRTRRLAAAGSGIAAVVAVALAIGVPAVLTGPRAGTPGPTAATPAPTGPPPSSPPLDQAGCPAVAAPMPTREDRPGPLVRTGATQATLCERVERPLPDPLAGQPRTLTAGVDQVTAHLNQLPDEETLMAKGRELARQQGHNPANVATGMGCPLPLLASYFSLVLRYPDGTTTVVWLDLNCGTVSADSRTRYGSFLDLFLRLYREQLVANTRPADIPTPACPPTLSPEDFVKSSGLVDEIARNREGVAFLPSPLAKATVCRYVRSTDGEAARLTKTSAPEVSERLRDLLNTATTAQLAFDCIRPEDMKRVRVLDLIRVADATAAVADVAVLRTPCGAVVRRGMGGLVPTPDLVGLLDANLGPVA